MGYITQFYNWVDGNTITAARSNGNISNIIDGLSDGTKDVNLFNIKIAGNTIIDENKNLISIGNITSLSSTDNNPLWKLISTNDNANSAELEFYKFSSTPADNDDLGRISFYGDDDGTNKTLFAQILVESSDVTDTTEDGKFTISTMVGGSSQNSFIIDGGNIIVSGTLTGVTSLTVDNLIVNGNDISSSSGNITLTPFAGNSVVIDGGASFDGGVVTGITDLTSTNIAGTLQTAAQANITSLGTLSSVTVSGVSSFSDGSAAAPSITNTGDTNTGLYFPSADTVGIVTGGVERARVDANGNVGIGTGSPDSLLHVANITGQAKITLESSDNDDAYINLSSQSHEMSFGYDRTDKSLRFAVGDGIQSNVRMKIFDTGKVFMPSLATSGSGNPVHITSSGELWENGSSKRFKTNIENLKSIDSSLIYKLNPVEYDRVNEEGEAIPGTHEIGFIAEEVDKILPIIVNYDKKEKESDPNIPRGVDKSILIPLIIKELQVLRGKVNSLELSAV